MSNVSFGFVQSTWVPGTVSFGFKLASLFTTYGLLVGEMYAGLAIEEKTTFVMVDEARTIAEADFMRAISVLDESSHIYTLQDPVTCLTVEGWDHA